MNEDIQNILRSLIEDNENPEGCFGTIEPYVNANRSIELDYESILDLLTEMVSAGQVELLLYQPKNGQFRRAAGESANMNSWYRVTPLGERDYVPSGSVA